MKKIILPVLLLAGLFTNAQVITGTNGVFTNSQPTQTFSSSADRNNKCALINAGKLIGTGTDTTTRLFNFYDFPANSLNTYNESFLDIEDRGAMTRLRFYARQTSGSGFSLLDKAQVINFEVKDDGSNISLTMPKPNSFVSIGANSFTDGAEIYRLSVNGAMRAHRVKVYTTWADYVFEEGYKLPTLEEVEKHIKEKGHLQDIPSAKEVEVNGIELGEMNKLLLQKIEELTLYMIDQKKESDKQGQLIKQLEEQVKVLSNKE